MSQIPATELILDGEVISADEQYGTLTVLTEGIT
jgi:hypothetical protein